MAVVTMKKLRLIGLSSEKEKIIGALLRSGAVQLRPTEEIDLTVRSFDDGKLDKAASVYSRAVIAIDFLSAQEKEVQKLIKNGVLSEIYRKEKKNLFTVREEVSADDFENVVLEEEKLLNVCAELEKIAAEKNEIKSRIAALHTLASGLHSYLSFPLKFSALRATKHVGFLLGTCKHSKSTESELAAVAQEQGTEISVTPVTDAKGKVSGYTLFAACRIENRQALEAALAPFGYVPCSYDFDCTAAEKLSEIQKESEELEKRSVQCTSEAVSYLHYRRELKLLSDSASFRMDMVRADGDFAKTAQTFILEGFVPEPSVEKMQKILDRTTKNADLAIEDVKPEDCPPTLLKNNSVVAPYESITSVYSPPSYYEADPNPAVAIFYFIFFGIMLGDAGYGLLLAVACFAATRFLKMEKGTKNLLLVFGMGGISAIVWGILFGGIFSIETVPAVWFAPMNDPITMLILCFALGLLQIFVGMGYQAYNLIKDGKVMDAVYDIFSWYAIFIGAGLTVLSVMVLPSLPVWVGLAVLIAGAVVLMGGGAIRAKGIVGRIIGAVSPLYGIVNYFSDVMSYSRLFGLCLASGVIGLVFNTLGGLVWGLPVIGWLLAVIIYLLGHTLNFAIGLLGIYVHDSRLQYIEFFGRFYHGGGKTFTPLGLNLKYVTIKQEV